MVECIKAWECVGCGKLEAPQPCIGVCQDRKVLLVYAQGYDECREAARRAEQSTALLKSLVQQLALTAPRNGEWERCYKALQKQARQILSALARNEAGRSVAESRAKQPIS
jgi:hypothetical protein